MRFVGRGHPAIRATHAKTLEITGDADITERATCVIAVGARPDPQRPLAGPVHITVSAGGHDFGFDAAANSAWDPTGPAVIRRSPLQLPGTLATRCGVAAADLPRELAAALRDPATEVTVTVAPRSVDRPAYVLFAADPSRPADPRLRAEADAAGAVIVEDDAARRLVSPRRGTGRTLVVATRDLPGATVREHLAEADVEVVGLSARLAAAAASPSGGPVLFAGEDSDARRTLQQAPAGARVVVSVPVAALAELLALRPTATLVQEHAPPLRARDGQVPALPTKDVVHACFDPVPAAAGLDPQVRRAVDALVADGVPTRTVARTLAALTGWDRRRAYDAALSWRPS